MNKLARVLNIVIIFLLLQQGIIVNAKTNDSTTTVKLNQIDEDNSELIFSESKYKLLDEFNHVIKENILINETGISSNLNLAQGKYSLIQTKAPDDYILKTTQVKFQISTADFNTIKTIVVKNKKEKVEEPSINKEEVEELSINKEKVEEPSIKKEEVEERSINKEKVEEIQEVFERENNFIDNFSLKDSNQTIIGTMLSMTNYSTLLKKKVLKSSATGPNITINVSPNPILNRDQVIVTIDLSGNSGEIIASNGTIDLKIPKEIVYTSSELNNILPAPFTLLQVDSTTDSENYILKIEIDYDAVGEDAFEGEFTIKFSAPLLKEGETNVSDTQKFEVDYADSYV